MKEGLLCYNNTTERYSIFFYSGGAPLDLHCGDAFWVQINKDGEWLQTHIEYDHDEKEWYLPGIGFRIDHLKAQIRD